MITNRIKLYQENNVNKSRWMLSFVNLFLAILCFFIFLNITSETDYKKNRELIKSLENEFKNKTIKQKIDEFSNARKTDSIAGFNQSGFEQINEIILQNKPLINLQENYYNNIIEINFNELGIINFEEAKLRPQTTEFLSQISNKINLLNGNSNKISVKIIAYKKNYNSKASQLNVINIIYSIFERANINGFDLAFFIAHRGAKKRI